MSRKPGAIQDGIDLVAQKRAQRSALLAAAAKSKTFRECAEAYMEAHASDYSNDKHRKQWSSTLDAYAYPKIGSLLVSDVTMRSVLDVSRVPEISYSTENHLPNFAHIYAMSNLPTHQFRKDLRSNLDEISQKQSCTQEHAFQYWCKTLLTRLDRKLSDLFDGPLSGDGGIDGILLDEDMKYGLIISCKYRGIGKQITRDEVLGLFSKHDHMKDRDWVRQLKNPSARDMLGEYVEMLERGFRFRFLFISTADASPEIKSLAEIHTRSYEDRGEPVTCELWDFSELKDQSDRAEKLERSLPEEVRFSFQQGKFVEISNLEYPTIVGAISGNELRRVYQAKKDSLFSYNIRTFMGSRGINNSIQQTADSFPKEFFFFNNGVTAICTGYTLDGNEVLAKGFQIINGAQTVGSLSKAVANADCFVLFRLIQTIEVKTDKGINRKIIQYNNTQNPVKISDFRSNDAIQTWLEQKFKDYRWKERDIKYSAKRGLGLRGALQLEDLSKQIWAFEHQPTLIYEAPKQLWTRAVDDDGGLYEKVFGEDGREVDYWSQERFERTTFTIAAFELMERKIEEWVDAAGAEENRKWLKRCRYHILALLGLLHRLGKLDPPLNDRTAATVVEKWWPAIHDVICEFYTHKVATKNKTLFSFVRNETEVWNGMVVRLKQKV